MGQNGQEMSPRPGNPGHGHGCNDQTLLPQPAASVIDWGLQRGHLPYGSITLGALAGDYVFPRVS